MTSSRVAQTVAAALRMVEDPRYGREEKIDMLVEIARGLRDRPRDPADLEAALGLLREARRLAGDDLPLPAARIRVHLAAVLREMPGEDLERLEEARSLLEAARPVLRRQGDAEEVADLEMQLGILIHTLAASGRAPMRDAVAAYQRALRTFTRERYPREFAILQNNLATAFLALSFSDSSQKMREALAVQCFEAGLSVLDPDAHPREWAMLQNNLGNALQSVRSGHPVANHLRALEAYRQALRVRNPERAPSEYANTIANMAHCLARLPDDPERPERGQRANLLEAVKLLEQAREIFLREGDTSKTAAVAAFLNELRAGLDGTGVAHSASGI